VTPLTQVGFSTALSPVREPARWTQSIHARRTARHPGGDVRHLHLLTTDGGKTADGLWQPLPEWDATRLMSLFRECLLARLALAHAISPELVKKLLAWKPPSFSAHVGEPIAPTDKLRLSDHIPDPGQHRTLSYGEYSNRVRGAAQERPAEPAATSTEPPPRRRCSPSWARLIAKVYPVDPLVCVRCGQRMSILAFVSDQHSINRILEHLDLRAAAG